MGGRTRTTFAKLQKERARQEKQRTKAERRQQRKQDGTTAAFEVDWAAATTQQDPAIAPVIPDPTEDEAESETE